MSEIEEEKPTFIGLKPIIFPLNNNEPNTSNFQLNLFISLTDLDTGLTDEHPFASVLAPSIDYISDSFVANESEVIAETELISQSLDPQIYTPINGEYKKPPYTYRVMIALLIKMSPEGALKVLDIYRGLREYFPYFKNVRKHWKNSARHCLAFGKWFVKSETHSTPMKGYKWMLREDCLQEFENDKRKQCISNFEKLFHCVASPEVCVVLQMHGLLSAENIKSNN